MTRYRTFQCIAAFIFALGLLIAAAPGWAAPARSKAPASLLPAELKGEDIKDYYIGPGAKDAGMIQTVIGYVVVAREGTNRAYYAAAGDRLFEKDIVFTLKGSKCRFQMNGHDVVTMGENTRLGIKTAEENRQARTKTTLFSMLKGKAMFYAMRLFKYRSTSMTVETPTAVSGVRGTKWGVEVVELPGKPAGKPVASLPIMVADNSPLGGFRHLATYYYTGQSMPGTATMVLSFSDTVSVHQTAGQRAAVLLAPGQMTIVGTGTPPSPPTTAPPNIINQFLEDTGVPGVQVSLTQPPSPTGSGTPTLSAPPDTTIIVQNLNSGNQRPTTHFGFFSGQLSWYNSACTVWDCSTTLTSVDLQDFSTTTAKAINDAKYVTINATAKTMTDYFDGTSFASPTGQALQMTELGYNAYTEWGTWMQPTAFVVNGQEYSFNTTGYYIWGDKTQTMPATISGTYRGNAYGTMVWQSSGLQSQSMTGTFQTDVTFSGGSGSLNNFQISTTGGGKSASIADGYGTFTGNTFSLSSGTVLVNGTTGTLGTVNGAFYGTNAQAVGGIWSVSGSGNYVNGVFQGTK
jgi:hypothetical protein